MTPSVRRNVFARCAKLFAQIEIEAENGEHSTLAGDLNLDAFADAVNYLKVRLGAANRPQRMKLAKLEGRPCEIGPDGRWRRL